MTAAMLTILTIVLTACDSRTTGDFKEERANRLYQAAMDDFTAGRLEAAAAGFEKVLRASPGNASARFQLACLQQDGKRDYLGAFCNYREYLLLAGDSDKAKLAKERMAICERLLADALAKKMNLTGNAAIAEESARLGKSVEALTAERDRLSRELAESRERADVAERENARLRRLLDSMSGEESESEGKASLATVRELLDGDEEEAPAGATALDEAKALNALADAEEADAGSASALLPVQGAGAKDRKKAAEAAERRTKEAKAAAKDAIPDTYVVQEGDTLYKIAVRFYGRTSAWKQIREANKESIATDGRVRSGMTIRLPK